MNKIDTKKALTDLLKQDGFSGVTATLGEIANETENLIRKENDSNLADGFLMSFLMMMELYPHATKKQQKFIRQFTKGSAFLDALDVLNWDSPNQSDAMKDARNTILEWQKS